MKKLVILLAVLILCFSIKSASAQEKQNLYLSVKAKLTNKAKIEEYDKLKIKTEVNFYDMVELNDSRVFSKSSWEWHCDHCFSYGFHISIFRRPKNKNVLVSITRYEVGRKYRECKDNIELKLDNEIILSSKCSIELILKLSDKKLN